MEWFAVAALAIFLVGLGVVVYDLSKLSYQELERQVDSKPGQRKET